jgi:hypothetical protein
MRRAKGEAMRSDRSRTERSVQRASAAVAAILLFCACGRAPAPATASASRPAVLTVSELQDMVDNGTPIGVMYSKIDSSGTVYRMTTEQAKRLRANGMPVAVMSYIEQGYRRAVQKNPDLATSDAQWTNIDGYWYGGLPFGWPREWVVGAPRIGEPLR